MQERDEKLSQVLTKNTEYVIFRGWALKNTVCTNGGNRFIEAFKDTDTKLSCLNACETTRKPLTCTKEY